MLNVRTVKIIPVKTSGAQLPRDRLPDPQVSAAHDQGIPLLSSPGSARIPLPDATSKGLTRAAILPRIRASLQQPGTPGVAEMCLLRGG